MTATKTKSSRTKAVTSTRASTSGHLIGYARVSTNGQETAVQEAKLMDAGCTIIRTEKAGGGSRVGRDELASTMNFIRRGDTLVVVKLDRLGRSTGTCSTSSRSLSSEGQPSRPRAGNRHRRTDGSYGSHRARNGRGNGVGFIRERGDRRLRK
jgi:Resolvase, N terminal domain